MKKLIPKKDVRILWNEEFSEKYGTNVIVDLIVVGFYKDNPENWPTHLYDIYDYDTGNCWVNWDETSLKDIFLMLLVEKEYIDLNVKRKAILELFKIEELNK